MIRKLRRENRALATRLRRRDALTLSDDQATLISEEIIAVADTGYAALRKSGD